MSSFGRADLEIGVVLARRLEELVVDIEANDVALGEARVALRALPVELYALYAYVLLKQALRQQRHGFAHKPVETLVRVVFSLQSALS